MPAATPGQIAYEAYEQRQGYAQVFPWDLLRPRDRACWDAAAQAVLEAFVSSARPLALPMDEETP